MLLKLLYIVLAFAALGTTFYYGVYYEAAEGATYHQTFAWLSVGAMMIFGGLFYASIVNKGESQGSIIYE